MCVTDIEDYRDGKDVWCPPFHDLLTCWPPTRAGEIVHKPCPDNIIGWDTSKYGFIECLENGSWYRHPQSPDKPWANYTTCLDWEDFTVSHSDSPVLQNPFGAGILL